MMCLAWIVGADPKNPVPSASQGGPLLYGYFNSLFKILFHAKTKAWEERFRTVAPHVPHSCTHLCMYT